MALRLNLCIYRARSRRVWHGVVIYGEDTYRKKVVFYLLALKPKATVASKAPRGRYNFDKPKNITGKYRQPNLT